MAPARGIPKFLPGAFWTWCNDDVFRSCLSGVSIAKMNYSETPNIRSIFHNYTITL